MSEKAGRYGLYQSVTRELEAQVKSKQGDFVKSIFVSLVAVWCLGIFFATPVAADAVTPGTYQLFDHPDANLTALQGPYGLRGDFIPPPGDGPVFSVSCVACDGDVTKNAFVTLVWDGFNATISGAIFNNLTKEMWTVVHTMTTNLEPKGFSSSDTEFTPNQSILTLTPPVGPDIVTFAKANGSGDSFLFLADGHRLGGYAGFHDHTIVGRGWLDEDGTNDWIVTAKRIPEPSTLLLLGPGLLGLGFFRRRLE